MSQQLEHIQQGDYELTVAKHYSDYLKADTFHVRIWHQGIFVTCNTGPNRDKQIRATLREARETVKKDPERYSFANMFGPIRR